MGLDSPPSSSPQPDVQPPAPPQWDAQFGPPPPTRPVPLPSPQLAPLPPVPPQPGAYHWDFYQRLSLLRERARQDAARATTLTNVAGALTAGLSALSLIFSMIALPAMLFNSVQVSSTAQSGAAGATTDASLILFMLVFVGIGVILSSATFIYSIIVLSKASRLFTQSYYDAAQLVHTTGIAVLSAQEEFWKQIQDQLAERSWIKVVGRSAYHSLEEHLDWCACHFPALRQLAEGKREFSIWQLRREENIYKSRKWFMQDTWVYWTCGCLLFIAMRVGYLVSLVYLIYGGRYINSRGVLVALCDFMLQEGADEPSTNDNPTANQLS